MKILSATILALCATTALYAQEPVQPAFDWASYGTAVVNPSRALWDAAHSSDPKCQLERLAVSSAITNAVVLTMKHFIVSPRPCLGCAPDGMPSGHTAESTLGLFQNPKVGISFVIGTGAARVAANRHTWKQVTVGALIGIGGEWAADRLLQCKQ